MPDRSTIEHTDGAGGKASCVIKIPGDLALPDAAETLDGLRAGLAALPAGAEAAVIVASERATVPAMQLAVAVVRRLAEAGHPLAAHSQLPQGLTAGGLTAEGRA
ncbi:MAG: hypothetical protein AAFS07_00030 [Pseudomonadota bacterium]